MNDCEDFVLKEQDDENEDSLNNNNSLKNNKVMDKDLIFAHTILYKRLVSGLIQTLSF